MNKMPLLNIVEKTKEILLENNIPFEIKNNGERFVIRTQNNLYYYYTGYGRFMINESGIMDCGGITLLIKKIIEDRLSEKENTVFEGDLFEMSREELLQVVYKLSNKLNKMKKNLC